MPDINPLTNNQIFLKKIAENTRSDYETGDVSEINPLTIDQIFLKEIAANTAGQSGDISELEEKVAANTEAIEATQDMLSDAYDSTHTYNVGDYCIHENVLYKCNTDIATPEAFTPAKWTATNIGGEITIIKSSLPDTGWITLNETYPTIYRYKNGYITVIMRLNGGATPTDGFVLGTLPNAYKPGVEICVATHNLRGCILVDTNGNVIIQANSDYVLNNYMAAVVIFPA